MRNFDLDAAGEAAFKRELVGLIPHLRAFARTLCGDPAAADDLAQDAMMKAWDARTSFQPGTNMKAWTFMILRNQFYSEKRRSWRQSQLDQEAAERTLVAADDPAAPIALDELRQALSSLPDEQREALILVGAGGFAYEEAAEICGCAVGTIKSRVARGRVALEALLADGKLPSRRDHETDVNKTALQSIMSEVDDLSRDRDPGG
jgi:RNA polymerase sigma-70 factor (ECF subfamily)